MNTPLRPLEHVACPLCGSQDHRLVFTRRDHTHLVSDIKFHIVRCGGCGLVFVNPRPSVDAIHAYYPNDFYQVELNADELLAQKQQTLHARLKVMGNLSPGRILDVGCQKGEFLYFMRQRGWEPVGVEFSSKPPNVYNLPIHYTELKDAPLSAGSFDVITLWAVLEHIHEPVQVLREVSRLLKPGGRAFVLVPNFNSIPAQFMRHDDVPRHLIMFTPRTLGRAAGLAGMDIRRVAFGDDIFSGHTRGVLNYAWKLARGESIEEIVAQNREPGRWREFSEMIRGRPNRIMRLVDRLDQKVTPALDYVVNALGLGFIFTAELVKQNRERTG